MRRHELSDREIGAVGRLDRHSVLDALARVQEGRVYDLDAGRWPGMPQWPEHPPFLLTTYRTPAGTAVQKDIELLDPRQNEDGFRFFSELLVTSMHAGTHLDALCHVSEDGEGWYGGFRPQEALGDFGAIHTDASTIAPIIVPGVLLDVAGAQGHPYLPPASAIGPDELQHAAEVQGSALPEDGAVLVRTGAMSMWEQRERYERISGAGITVEAAEWLLEVASPVVVGADTPAVEQQPSTVPTHPQPVHDLLLRVHGVHLLEMAQLEQLARERIYEFAFICLPLKVSGASASMVRPVVVV